jgi:ectoine hydroxylase-related dioxygenase (phytanoyl-CoA dioxygenase family)
MASTDLAAAAAHFRDDGVVFIPRALDDAALGLALEAYEWSLNNPSPAAAQFPQNKPGRFYQDLANPRAIAAYRRLLAESPAADIAAALWGGRDVWFMYEQVFLKEGGEARRTPWHQDSSYLPIEGRMIAVMWITFEPVAKEDSLEFVRGSHRGILYDGSRFDPADDTAPLYGDGSMPRLPAIEADRSRFDIVSWAVAPGDVLVFHPAMLHGGAPTHAGRRRRTLSLRFFGDDAIYAPRLALSGDRARSRADDPEASVFSRLPAALKPGTPLRHPGFPKIRPRASS